MGIASLGKVYQRTQTSLAASHLAIVYDHSLFGITQDKKYAYSLYETTVLQFSCPTSCYDSANLQVKRTDGVEPNAPRAVSLYEQSIRSGECNASHDLALHLLKGSEGVLCNIQRALQLYEEVMMTNSCMSLQFSSNQKKTVGAPVLSVLQSFTRWPLTEKYIYLRWLGWLPCWLMVLSILNKTSLALSKCTNKPTN